ncbi:facilitated trehalose transporter Tret1-like [Diorhabda carinulata]|uniref:facilitated trehalose transporter Tret1-like n=1 Tax=Diorhabda carinulata TaxID=1163345 RepID=UPI0025A29244|nr:facilitated trehalose transporter Tret1-like [Diorhabda carinulata]
MSTNVCFNKNSDNVVNEEDTKEVIYADKHESIDLVQKSLEEDAVRKADTKFLAFSVLIGTMPLISIGANLVWTSPMLPYLQSNDSNINPLETPISVWQTSVLAASPIFASLIGPVLLSKLSDIVGRKKFLLITTIAMLFLFVIPVFLNRFSFLLICRVSIAIISTGFIVINQVYVAEICEDHNRAKYLCLSNLFLPTGNVYTYLLGGFLDYIRFNILIALPLLVSLFFCFAPESPVHSLSKGKLAECKNALIKLRSNKNVREIDADLNKLDHLLKSTKSDSRVNFIALFRTKTNRRALKITLLLLGVKFLSGIAPIASFLEPVLRKSGATFSVHTLTVTIGLVQIMTFVVASFFIEKFGRKVLLVFSCFCSAFALFSFGLFCFLKSRHFNIVGYLKSTPIICILLYIISFGVGLGSVTNTVVAEIFPPDVVTIGMSLSFSLSYVVISATIFLFPIIEAHAGLHICLWVFGFFCCLGGISIYLIVPETRGRTSLEIQKLLQRNAS